MKVFNTKSENILYFLYRLINIFVDPIKAYRGITGIGWFIRDYLIYKKLSSKDKLLTINLFPILHEKTPTTPFDAHYFFQEIWAVEHIIKNKPTKHVDIGSTYSISGLLSKFVPTEFVDIRPIETNLSNLTVVNGNVLNLPYKNNSLSSISSLHVIEHIGLGRYGDDIDPHGTKKACKEIMRVLKKKGYFYVSVPIGYFRICFNAHRVHPPSLIIEYCKGLTLKSFSVVTDDGTFIESVDYKKYETLHYGCGMFLFQKP